jgi:hypothetical protein
MAAAIGSELLACNAMINKIASSGEPSTIVSSKLEHG